MGASTVSFIKAMSGPWFVAEAGGSSPVSPFPGLGRHVTLTGRLGVALVPLGHGVTVAAWNTLPGIQTPVLTAYKNGRSGWCSVQHVGRLMVQRRDKLRTADQQRM